MPAVLTKPEYPLNIHEIPHTFNRREAEKSRYSAFRYRWKAPCHPRYVGGGGQEGTSVVYCNSMRMFDGLLAWWNCSDWWYKAV